MYIKMEPGKKGRVKYLVMTLLPAYLFTKGMGRLASQGVLPDSDVTGFLIMACSLGLMGVLGYFLVFRKNHVIEIGDLSVSENDWQGKCKVIPLGRINGWKKNLLNEILLTDENGRVILCVESNMENRAQFERWLESRQLHETN